MDSEIVVIGSGMSGICVGIGLKKAGFDDFAILERAHDVGGTWRDHKYPGLTVDVPCLTYSYSFEQKPDWSSLWAPRDEVFAYCKNCADKYGLVPHVRFGKLVAGAAYDAAANQWVVSLADGSRHTARYLINASGLFSEPKWPDIPGLDDFEGSKLHTSAWSRDTDLSGKRVAFIGTGATGIQLAPEIAKTAAQIHVFQRTPIWLLPKPAMRFPEGLKKLFKLVPPIQHGLRLATAAFMDLVFFRVFIHYTKMGWFGKLAERICKRHIRKQVDDKRTVEELTPTYSWGCKRPSFSNDFYPMFNKENVELITAGIDRLDENAIVSRDGTRREVDAIICATGYQPFERASLPTYPVTGLEGTELRALWDERRYQGYRGIAVHGFPNFFMVFGPYSIPSSSYIAMVEISTRNIIGCLKEVKSAQADYIEVTAEAQRAEFDEVQAARETAIWTVGSCAGSNTFYIDRHGDTPTFRPVTHPVAWWESRNLPVARDFVIRRAATNGTPTAGAVPLERAHN